MRRIRMFLATAIMAAWMVTPGYAGQWRLNQTGWWYQNDDATWPSLKWQWIDGNHDGIFECYAFDANGYMYANTMTPDGYYVGTDGAWVQDGVRATRAFVGGIAPAPTEIGLNATSQYYGVVSSILTGKSSASSGSVSTASSSKTNASKTTTSKNTTTSRDTLTSADIVKKTVKSKSNANSSNTDAGTTGSGSSSSTSSGSPGSSSSSGSSSGSGSSSTSGSSGSSSKSGSSKSGSTKSGSSSSSSGKSGSGKPGSSSSGSSSSGGMVGPGANLPKTDTGRNIGPTADISEDSQTGPKGHGVIERDGSDDDEEDEEDDE